MTATLLARRRDAFRLHGTNAMTESERQWWKRHGQEIVDTMAAANGPDVIGLLHDKTSYGVYGDHGGAQESRAACADGVLVAEPGVRRQRPTPRSRRRTSCRRSCELMGIPVTEPVDGVARRLDA